MAELTIEELESYFSKLPQQDGRGPASEATLRELAKAMGAKVGGTSPVQQEQKKLTRSTKQQTEATDEINVQLRKFEDKLYESERGLYSLWTGTKMFGSQLMQGRASLTGFADTMVESADVLGNQAFYALAKTFQ